MSDRKALITALALLYLQGDMEGFAQRLAEITATQSALDAITASMLQARVDSYLAVYEQDTLALFHGLSLQELHVYANRADAATLPVGQSALLADVQKDVDSIAHTWGDIISTQVSAWDASQEASALTASVHTALSVKAEDRAQLVATHTVQKATDSAQRQFANDTVIRTRVLTVNDQSQLVFRSFEQIAEDAQDEGVPYDVEDVYATLEDMYATVLPEEASNDICSEYAGNTYDAEDVDLLPFFPAHPACPHEIKLLFSVS